MSEDVPKRKLMAGPDDYRAIDYPVFCNPAETPVTVERIRLMYLGLLLLGHLVLVHTHLAKGADLGDGQGVDVGVTHANGTAEHATTLQRPLITDDGKDPLTGELHLGKDLLGQIIAVAQMQIHLGDALIGLSNRHLDVVDKGAEERPLLVGSLSWSRSPSCSQAVPRPTKRPG